MIQRVVVSFVDEMKHVAIATSDGRSPGTSSRWCASTSSASPSKARTARAPRRAAAAAWAWSTSTAHSPEDLAREAARQAVLLQSAVEAPAGMFPVVLAAGDSGILLHEAVGHGLEADFNRKKTSNYSDRIGQLVASTLCTVVDDGTIPSSRGTINVDDEGNLPRQNVLIENGILQGYMQDRISARHFGVAAIGQRPARVLQPLPDAAHDEHLHAAGREQPGGHHPQRRARHLLRRVQRRAGEHLQRRLRLLRDRGLS